MNINKMIPDNILYPNYLVYFVGLFLLTLICVAAGYGVVLYGNWVDGKLLKLLLLPLIFIFCGIFMYDKRYLFLFLICIRIPIDPLIEVTKQVSSISPGALMNAFVLLIAILLFFEKPRPIINVVLPLWFPLIFIIIFQLLRAPDKSNALRTALTYSTYIAVFLIPFYLKECQENMKFSCNFILTTSLIPVFYGLAVLMREGLTVVRISSSFPHPNIFAFYLVSIITLLVYKIKEPIMSKSTFERWICVGYMLLVFAMLLSTKTRSAWAAAIGVFFLYGFFFEKKYFIYIIVAGFIALFIPSVRDRLSEISTSPVYWGLGQDSYEWRKALWNSSWSWTQFSALPFGYGLDAFMYHSQEFFPFAYGRDVGAHSVYRQWLFEAGVVGILCAAWLYVCILRLCWRIRKITKLGNALIYMIIIEYLVISYSDNMLGYLSFNWIYWFLLGSACSVSYAKFGPLFFRKYTKFS